ncbi:hypothetical protein [Sulfuriflexus mobilis]|uniref:hypothetical protein n=1 Tax=Sulfuriflexus mobilis TaxID=1811807 RepID=UPI000F839F8F|nr:hypothetical protein [Sulfuriflexus mobilis]
MKRDDDIVRALGFVALYAAYVEEGVDVVMERLALIKEITDKERKWPISRKINWCIDVLESLESDELEQLVNLLGETKEFLERRNEVIHGRIYAGNERSENLKSGRPGVPEREVTADELYDLAEDLFERQAAVPNINMFATLRAITENKSA